MEIREGEPFCLLVVLYFAGVRLSVPVALEDMKMDIVTKTVLSRKKSITMLEKELTEITEKVLPLPATSPARIALEEVAKVKKARLEKLCAELGALLALVNANGGSVGADPRQMDIAGTVIKKVK